MTALISGRSIPIPNALVAQTTRSVPEANASWTRTCDRRRRRPTLWKRGRQYWMDTVVGGRRYRKPLLTTDWREAKDREKQHLAELARRPADPARRGRSYGALDVTKGDRGVRQGAARQVSPRMVAYWTENAKPLGEFFGTTTLRNITPEQIAAYQNARIDAGRAPNFALPSATRCSVTIDGIGG